MKKYTLGTGPQHKQPLLRHIPSRIGAVQRILLRNPLHCTVLSLQKRNQIDYDGQKSDCPPEEPFVGFQLLHLPGVLRRNLFIILHVGTQIDKLTFVVVIPQCACRNLFDLAEIGLEILLNRSVEVRKFPTEFFHLFHGVLLVFLCF